MFSHLLAGCWSYASLHIHQAQRPLPLAIISADPLKNVMNDHTCSLLESLESITQATPARIIISNPQTKTAPCTRVDITAATAGYQISKRIGTQVFHENIMPEQLCAVLSQLMQDFTQLNAFTPDTQYRLRLTKKGKVQFGRQAAQAETPSTSSTASIPAKSNAPVPAPVSTHNRQKQYLLPEGQAIAPLVDMGVFTPEGRIIKAMYHKYRQINRFLEIVKDALQEEHGGTLHILDFGCGKSYLTFVLYHYLSTVLGLDVRMTGLDLKADVVAKCNAAAQRYGYQHLAFEVGDINGYQQQTAVDMVITLHACDTATDYALHNAVKWGARMIFSVPCCQHELNAQMHSDDLAILTRYGIVQERIAALMTDAIRANLLQACGYKTQLLEFIDLEHTPKNILIRAVRSNSPMAQRQKFLAEAERLMQAFAFQPTLYTLLQQMQLFKPLR